MYPGQGFTGHDRFTDGFQARQANRWIDPVIDPAAPSPQRHHDVADRQGIDRSDAAIVCRFDRALILEDPDGTRLLYDAGRTVAGPEDPRLGRVDVVLVSHLHGDHVGDRRIADANAGSCAEPETAIVAAPNSNSVYIALAKGARIITSARGVFLTDSEGNEILDGMAGLWCVNIGYGRDELAEAAARQIRELPYYNTFFQTSHTPVIELAAKLAELVPGDLNNVFFASSGSEANDTNIRMVRHYWAAMGKPEKTTIISRRNAYHGSTVVGASLGVRQCLLDEHVDGHVVQDVAVVVDDAVLAMRRVRVQRNIGDDGKLGQRRLDGRNGALHEPVRVRTLGAVETFLFLVDNREQGDGRNAQVANLDELIEQAVDALTRDAGHGRDVFLPTLTVEHENRVNEICARKRVFLYEATQRGRAAVAAHSNPGELSGGWCTHSNSE